jgi:hypothetical protein
MIGNLSGMFEVYKQLGKKCGLSGHKVNNNNDD